VKSAQKKNVYITDQRISNCSNTMIMINNFFDSRKEQKLLYYYRLSYIQFCHHQVFKESIQSFCYISVQWLFIMESFFCLGVSKNHISHRYKCWWSVTAWVLYINIIPVMITFFLLLASMVMRQTRVTIKRWTWWHG